MKTKTATVMTGQQEKNRLAYIRGRLAYLRREIKAERISYGELVELQALASYIAPDDTLLLEAACVTEKT